MSSTAPPTACQKCERKNARLTGGLCRSCYMRKRRKDKAGEAERDRLYSRAWKAAHREHVRAYDAAYGREHRGTCEVCDGPMGIGQPADGTCRSCRQKGKQLRRELIRDLWLEGLSRRELAAAIGTSINTVQVEMAHMRADGWDLPYRYNVRNGRRVAA